MAEFQPVQLVEQTKEYEFKPYVEKSLSPYKVYYLVKDNEVFKMMSIGFRNKFIIMPLLSHSKCCHEITDSQDSVEKLLKEYDAIYTVPSEYDSNHQCEYNKAFNDLTNWIYKELVQDILYDKENN